MWLHPYIKQGWRELRRSMSWQRPGGKFLKIVLIPELSCIFWVLKMGVLKTPEYVLTCQGNLGRNHNCQQGKPTK
jgi:hypothetical protein